MLRGGLLVKMQHKQHFFIQKLADVGKKNTTFAAKFNKKLADNEIYICRTICKYLKIQKRLPKAVFFVL